MADMKKRIDKLQDEFEKKLKKVEKPNELESLRLEFLGKRGTIRELMSMLKTFSVEEKRELGPEINNLKVTCEEKIVEAQKKIGISKSSKSKKSFCDVSAYIPSTKLPGTLHVITQFTEIVENIFLSMGFDIVSCPEVEDDFHNFVALNIPKDHPARDMQDTFWLNKNDYLLRTHTSTVQSRIMQHGQPPFACVSPGRVFRHEATDASHDMMFWQCEGFLVDKNVKISHLLGTVKSFLSKLFETENLDIRTRPGYFPFVEPGLEIDMRCTFCKNGCSVCKKSTWLEVFPGGMIHPNVLKICGIDPKVYSGFAFGFGLGRLAMLRHNIDDIRLLTSGKISFLQQF